MNFDLTDDQAMLKDSITKLLAGQYTFEQRKAHRAEPHGWSAAMWRQFAEMGLLMLPFAEEDGGLSLGEVETMIVMEAFGQALVVEPYFATVILAGGLIRHAANAEQRAELVPAIGAGELRLAFAHGERNARYDLAHVQTSARPDGDLWRIDGDKSLVLHGDSAHKLIVSARVSGARTDRDGIALFLIDADAPGVSRRSYETQDGMRAAEVSFSGAHGRLIGEAGKALPIIEQVVDEAVAALCAEAVGVMAESQALTLDYVKVRKQFGTALSSFQVTQFKAAEMLVQLEMARSMALLAIAMSTSPDVDERQGSVQAAKVQIGRSGRLIGQSAIQMYGGVGVTDEYKISHCFKRLTMIDKLFGDADYHLTKRAEALLG